MKKIDERSGFDADEILKIEAEVQHDMIAFDTDMANHVGPEGRYIHLGLTSSDVEDTASALRLRQSLDVVIRELDVFMKDVLEQAKKYKHTPSVGRSHGVHAEPTTLGLKFALWYAEMQRNLERMEHAHKITRVGKISGAVGTYANVDPFVEKYVCEQMGLEPSPISTQVLQRDRYAELLSVIAITGCSLEKFATEVRGLQKTELREVEEPFRAGQKGSSAMPHKRNPITMEKVCGLSRVVKSNAQVAFDNVALWHERDISHSSAERVAQADSFIALDHMFQCLIRVIDGLQLYPARMMANLNKTRGLIFSSKVLLALVDTGITREDAYAIVQENAMATWHEVQDCVSGPTFKERLEADPRCTVSQEKLDEIFDPWDFLTRIDTVFDRLEQLSFE